MRVIGLINALNNPSSSTLFFSFQVKIYFNLGGEERAGKGALIIKGVNDLCCYCTYNPATQGRVFFVSKPDADLTEVWPPSSSKFCILEG